nr:unnamed protein product [Digitaria exilis]
MSQRRRPRAAGSPPGDAGLPPSPEKAGRNRPWAALGSDRRVLALALAFRAANALLVRTYFNPDEHWQCLEVAHRIAFGYGHLTWEWKRGLRSYLHPLIFAALYKILALLHLDTPWFMMKSKCRFVFLEVIPVGAIVLAVTTLLDWWMYGQQVRRVFHSHFKVDRDLQSSVIVYSQRDVL